MRLFRCWENVDPERSPFGLALRIANNLMWDEARKHQGREILGDVPERATAHDVEELTLARIELHRARKLLDRLNPNHRSVLLAEVGGEELPERNSAATKMVRMRARKRLSALMSNVSSFGVVFSVKDMARRFSDFARRNTSFSEQASATAVAAAGIVAAVVVLGAPSQAPGATIDRSMLPIPSQRSFASAELASARKAIGLEAAPISTKTSGARHVSGATVSPNAEDGNYVAVPEGGPADGGATFGVVPDEDENWTPSVPTCHQNLDPERGEVGAGCYVDGPGDDVNAGVDLEVGP